MGKHSIDTIAEVLIDKLDAMEEVAIRIEKVAKTPLRLELEPIKKLFDEQRDLISKQNTEEKQILSDIKKLQQKNSTRLPNWVLGFLFAFFIGFVGSVFFAYSNFKKVHLLKLENNYYLQKLDSFQKGKK